MRDAATLPADAEQSYYAKAEEMTADNESITNEKAEFFRTPFFF